MDVITKYFTNVKSSKRLYQKMSSKPKYVIDAYYDVRRKVNTK